MKSLQKIKHLGLAIVLLLSLSFKLTGQQSPPAFIEMLYPEEAGIEMVLGSEVLISWNSNFVNSVKVELYDYTVPATPVITMIAPSVVGTTVVWDIDDALPIGDKYKIRVTSNILASKFTESTNFFALVATAGGDILVEQPNLPGISWLRGTENVISWVTDLQENVKIELFSATPFAVHADEASNYGGSWNVGDNEGTGFGNWSITTGTGVGGVAVYEIGDPADGEILMDDPAFSIIAYGDVDNDPANFVYADREFLQPLEVDQRFALDWGVNFATGNKGFNLYSGGIDGTKEIEVTYADYNDGIFINGQLMFENPGLNKMTTYFKYESVGNLRVYGIGRDGTESFNQVFSVSEAPDAIRFFAVGIRKNPDPLVMKKRTLYFDNLRIVDYTKEIAASVPSSTYYWDIPANFRPGNDYKIRISSTVDNTILDESDNDFSIVATLGGEIEVLQPVAGDYLLRDNQYLISWIDDVAEPLNVHLWKDGAYLSTIQNNVIGSTYIWSIGSSHLSGDNFQIRVFSPIDGNVQDLSGFFDIGDVLPGGEISLEQPNVDGLYWKRGNSYLISWIDNITEPVDIDLMQANGTTLVRNLFTNVTGSTKVWPIPSGEPLGHYKIRVKSSLAPNDVEDVSDFTFEIGELPEDVFILLHQPNVEHIVWLRGTANLLSWSHNVFPDGLVDIHLLRDDDNNYEYEIATNVPGSTRAWTIPIGMDIYDGYRIRVSSSVDPTENVTSEFPFSISNFLPGGELEVLQPNGGEEWIIGDAYIISWIGNYTGNVDVFLLKGGVWVADIALDVSGTTVAYTFPTTLAPGNDYKVYIENTLDASVFDHSDADFSLSLTPGGTIEVLNPVAGDIWFRGQQHLISWIDDLLESVDIQLYKGGVFLENIDSDVEGSTYIWSIPNHLVLDTDYSIRVESSLDPSYFDDSGVFEITLQVLANIYPNPANNQFTVQFNEEVNDTFELELTNRFGLPIYRTTVNTGGTKSLNVNTYDLPDGVYFLRMKSSNYIATEKIVIKR